MTEPPRPPGEEPYSPPQPPPASYPAPGEAPPSGYAPPPAGPPQYGAPPPPGGFPPPGGAPGPGVPPPGYANNDDKTWALIAHFGGGVGMLVGVGVLGWVAPLIALLVKGPQSPTVRQHAVAALNFQLLWSIVGVVGWILACIIIGFFIWAAAMIIGIVFAIIAGLKANEGQFYKYPMSFPIVK